MSTVQQKVNKVLDRYHTSEAVYHLEIDHDGYDSDGPESDIYDLYVLDKSYVYIYHYEDWFRNNEDDFVIIKVVPSEMFFLYYPNQYIFDKE